mgnify:CR=1 FL=1
MRSPIMRLDGGMPRRVTQLLVGLFLYGAGCALTIEAGLGVDPWNGAPGGGADGP